MADFEKILLSPPIHLCFDLGLKMDCKLWFVGQVLSVPLILKVSLIRTALLFGISAVEPRTEQLRPHSLQTTTVLLHHPIPQRRICQ